MYLSFRYDVRRVYLIIPLDTFIAHLFASSVSSFVDVVFR